MNRREQGTGTVYYVPSKGKWRARLIVNGKQITRSAATEKEAKTILKQLIRNQHELISKDGTCSKSFGTYIDNWLVLYKKDSLAGGSYRSLEYDINHYVKPHVGRIPLDQLSTDDIQQMIANLVAQKRSLSLISRARSAVDSCLKKAVKVGDIKYNPCTAVEMPTAKRHQDLKAKPICVLEQDEVASYVKTATLCWPNGTSRYRIGSGFVFVLSTGIRKGEAAALEWKDIDFVQKSVHIHQSAALVKDENTKTKRATKQIIQDTTKSKSGDRLIALNDSALNALRDLLPVTGEYKYVLGTSKEEPIHLSTLTAMHSRIMKAAGITRPDGIKTGMHCLRHTFCSHLIMFSDPPLDVKTISEIMGHADINITLDTYGHIFESKKRKAIMGTDFIQIATEKERHG